jgi:hypothetical protein
MKSLIRHKLVDLLVLVVWLSLVVYGLQGLDKQHRLQGGRLVSPEGIVEYSQAPK